MDNKNNAFEILQNTLQLININSYNWKNFYLMQRIDINY